MRGFPTGAGLDVHRFGGCVRRVRPRRRKRGASRGFSLFEVLVICALIGILVGIAGPVAGKLIRRSEDMAALSTARQVLAVARLEAIKTGANVVVVVSKTSSNAMRLLTFRDKADLTVASSKDGDGEQQAGEPTLGQVTLSPRIHFWKQGGRQDDVGTAVLFDTYVGDASSRCIVFLPSGGISPPSSGPATPAGGRGIYFADWQGKNYFRITVESTLSAKARVDKYVAGSDYVTSGWRWL